MQLPSGFAGVFSGFRKVLSVFRRVSTVSLGRSGL